MRSLSKGNYRVLAQSIAEICLLLFVVVVALVSIQLYVKRALQARFKGSVDAAVTMALLATNAYVYKQYEPYYKDEKFSTTSQEIASEIAQGEEGQRSLQSRTHLRQDSEISSKQEADFYKGAIWSWEED